MALAPLGPCVLVGDGADLVPRGPGLRRPPGGVLDRISPVALVQRVREAGPRAVAPEYLRLPDAEENRLRREREGATA